MQLLSDLLFSGEDPLQASAAPAAKGFAARGSNASSLDQQQQGRAFASAFDTASRTEVSADPLTFETPSPQPDAPSESTKRLPQGLSAVGAEISPAGDHGVQPHKGPSLNEQGYAVAEIPAGSNAPAFVAPATTDQDALEPDQLRVTSAPAHRAADGVTPPAADESANETTPPMLKAGKPVADTVPSDTIATTGTAAKTTAAAPGLRMPGLRMNDRADGLAPVVTVQGRSGTDRSNGPDALPVRARNATDMEASVPFENRPVKGTLQSGVQPSSALQQGDSASAIQGTSSTPGKITADSIVVTDMPGYRAAPKVFIRGMAVAGQTSQAVSAATVQTQSPVHATTQAKAPSQDPFSAPVQSETPPQGMKLSSLPFDVTIATYTPQPGKAAPVTQAAQSAVGTHSSLSVPAANASVLTMANDPALATQRVDLTAQGLQETAGNRPSQIQSGIVMTASSQPAAQMPPPMAAPPAETPAAIPATAPTVVDLTGPVAPANPAAGPVAPKTETATTAIELADAPVKTASQSTPAQAEGQQVLFTSGSAASTTSPAAANNLARMIADPAIQSQALQQVASAIEASHKGSGKMELRLDPPELGRVSIDFRFDGDNRVTAILHADQPETATLMRRSLDILMRDLASAGFTDVNVTMGSGGRDAGQAGQQQADQQQTGRNTNSGGQYASARETETQAQKAPQAYRPAWSADTIDIRL